MDSRSRSIYSRKKRPFSRVRKQPFSVFYGSQAIPGGLAGRSRGTLQKGLQKAGLRSLLPSIPHAAKKHRKHRSDSCPPPHATPVPPWISGIYTFSRVFGWILVSIGPAVPVTKRPCQKCRWTHTAPLRRWTRSYLHIFGKTLGRVGHFGHIFGLFRESIYKTPFARFRSSDHHF